MSYPLVSVVIPTFNRRDYVLLAVESACSQTYPSVEIIVVDDGSVDGTGKILRDRFGERIEYIWQDNRGESAARNRGIASSKGEFIALLDSDDVWLPAKLAKQVGLLESDPGLGVTYSWAWRIDAKGDRLSGVPMGAETSALEPTLRDLCLKNLVIAGGSTAVIRRSLLGFSEPFAVDIQFGEDWDLWLRLVGAARIRGIPEPLACVRLHRSGQWWYPNVETVDKVLADHLRILEKAFSAWQGDPEEAQELRSRAVAQQYAAAAWANYVFNRAESARRQLSAAIDLDPRTWKDPQEIDQGIIGTAVLLANMQPGRLEAIHEYVDKVLDNLPDALHDIKLARQGMLAKAELEVGYALLASGKNREGRSRLLRAFSLDPRLMLNKGTLITLSRSFRIVRSRRFTD